MSDDVMNDPWCCLTCSAKFRFGEIIMADACRCPRCRSADLHPADKAIVVLERYDGEKGTIQ